jgi:cytochrome c5
MHPPGKKRLSTLPHWVAIILGFTIFPALDAQTDKDSLGSLLALPLAEQPLPSVKPSPLRPSPPKTPRDAASGKFIEDTTLAYDATLKEIHPKAGSQEAALFFMLSNPTPQDVIITRIQTSCGCTVAKSPQLPWKLKPGEEGTIDLTLDLRHKFGTLTKSVSVFSTAGRKFLTFKAHLEKPPVRSREQRRSLATRMDNLQQAMRNRQAVFQGDCRRCHYDPCLGKEGKALYDAACGICHDSQNRAAMVPDLMHPVVETRPTLEYWTHWITHGKEQSLMPAFEKKAGGPLDAGQIASLAAYLTNKHAVSQEDNPGASP